MNIAKEQNFSKFDNGLPYDKEVEWLQGDGHAYIATGVQMRLVHGFHVDFISSGKDLSPIIGKEDTRLMFSTYVNNTTYLRWRGADNGNHPSISTTEFNVVDVRDGVFTVNGYDYPYVGGAADASSLYQTYIFAYVISDTNIPRISTHKIRSVVLLDDVGNALFDGIAVRKGKVGYFYDRVSGQLLGNANSTGDFVVGPDVRRDC